LAREWNFDPITITGDVAMRARLRLLGARAPGVVGGALYRFAERVMAASKREVPVKTGVLRGSGHVVPPTFRGGQVEVELGYGGPAMAYATEVHENENAEHKDPTKWKYLEDPLKAAAGELLADVGAVVREALMRQGGGVAG
jgi:hypothetical protein